MSFISGTGLTSGQSSGGNISSIVIDIDQITNNFINDSLIISSNYTDLKTESNTELINKNIVEISNLITESKEDILTNSNLIYVHSGLISENKDDISTNSHLIYVHSGLIT